MIHEHRRQQGGGPARRGARSPRGNDEARFYRETDTRARRTMGRTLVASALAVLAILGVVGIKVHHVRLSYQLDRLRGARAEADEQNRRLRVEVAALSSLARVETKARAELGMVPPTPAQERLAREFVAGGAGLVRDLAERAAITARSPIGPTVR